MSFIPVRILKEYLLIEKSSSSNLTATMNVLDPWEWTIAVFGPPETPYANGMFLVKMVLPESYPMNPPSLTFLTKIYHPNVDEDGVFYPCCSCTPPNLMDSRNWNPARRISNVLELLEYCLINPVTQCDGNGKIKEAYINDKEKFEAQAREWTRKYAQ